MGDELVRLATAASEIEANIWRDALEQDGIRTYVRNRAPLAYLGSDAFFATYELFVLASDERRARWVIGEDVAPMPPQPDGDREGQETAAAD